MNVLISVEERFHRTPDGKIWSAGAASYSFWKRYLDVFEEVRVLGRVTNVSDAPASWKQANGDGVMFQAFPYYVGPLEYARKLVSIRAAVRKALDGTDAIILRVASPIGQRVQREMAPGRPFGAEVIGDPYEVFAPGAIDHPLRPLLRWMMTRQLRRQCQKACAVSYVTEGTLQQRYRPSPSIFSTTYSSIELRDEAFAACSRNFVERPRPSRIVSVGTLEVPYKGFDVLIDAASICIKNGLTLELEIIGDGRCRPELERHAKLRGIAQQVTFAGQISAGAAVRCHLDNADLFVLTSKTEGLPRAMIEAMARGLPCIGSAVGGIPELLAPGELVPRGEPIALSHKLREILTDRSRMTRLSAENLDKARSYHDSILRHRRRQFFCHVREATENWSLSRKRADIELRPQHDPKGLRADRTQ